MSNFDLNTILDDVSRAIGKGMEDYNPLPETEEIGTIRSVDGGIVWAGGLSRVKYEELVVFGDGSLGMVLDILPDRVGIVLFGQNDRLAAGQNVSRTHRILDVPVGRNFAGRVVDPLGRPLDGLTPIREDARHAVLKEAPQILDRSPVVKPLQTGLKVVDALIPVGRGQRELILGDRQTGKTAIALDTIINQRGKGVKCIYCAIGQRSAGVAKVIADLKDQGAMAYTTVVVVEGGDPAGLQYIAPYAATTMAEYFMQQGEDALIVYDDLTRHALAYRQLSLMLRRPPGREAFPGDIFYIHSRLLERATHLKPHLGGGSLTALPIAETEAQNISAYIPTNLISITDGQLYLTPDLFQKGILPAVDVGKSVSRVGGKAQIPAYRKVTGDLRFSYSQFQELESFARFGARLDDHTRKTLEHGIRVREILKQDQFSPLRTAHQIVLLLAVTQGLLDDMPENQMAEAQNLLLENIDAVVPELEERIETIGSGDPLWTKIEQALVTLLKNHKWIDADTRSIGQKNKNRTGSSLGG
ncbi:MAG: ATP F0F1 synthase subunit alpha [Desulfatitalea sp. BRH_c12]|nr:MAG: ATP F0F1 synthase subunit alpha [Desulfatitalea sp. BRH_c12]